MSTTQYLQRKGRTWRVHIEIPAKLRSAAGDAYGKTGKPLRRFIRSLGTESLTEANRLKHSHVAEFKRRIALLEKGLEDPRARLIQAALAFRTAFDAPDNERLSHGEHETDSADQLLDGVNEEVKEVLEREGSDAAALFYGVATGKVTLIRDHYSTWLAQHDGKEQTKKQHTATIKRYLAFAGDHGSIEATTRKKAYGFIEALRSEGLSRKTIARHVSAMSSFWRWLKSSGLADITKENPWRDHMLGKKQKRAFRKGFSDEAILKLLNADYETDRYAGLFPDLVRLGLLTGARLDELCSLKSTDIEKRKDGYWLTVGDGKTDAAIRRIPLHKAGAAIVARRLREKDEYLFSGLVPGGPDKKRSWNVSKAYGRFRKQPHVGLSAKGEDFHALRTTFMEHMEKHEVPESTVKLLVGHARESITFGHYSKGALVELRKHVGKLDYGREVMAAIATIPQAR